jgi:hypothetical protein
VNSRADQLQTPAGRHKWLFGVVLAGLVGAAVLAESPEPEKPSANDPKRFAFDKDRQYLLRVLDFHPLRIGGQDAKAANEKAPFEDLVLHAHGFTQDELLSAARTDVSYGNMASKDDLAREEVRFELVRVEGKLKRLQRMGSPDRLREAGIPELYEAWIFTDARPRDPLCVILSEPPEGVEPAVDITPTVPVVTAGYFFKIVEYPSNEPNPEDSTRTLYRRAPLLVGRSAVVDRAAAPPPSSVTSLVTVSLVLGGAVLVAVLAMTYWFRRSDTGARRVNALRRRNPYTAQDQPAEPDAGPAPDDRPNG